jgi:hypothetical protein
MEQALKTFGLRGFPSCCSTIRGPYSQRGELARCELVACALSGTPSVGSPFFVSVPADCQPFSIRVVLA